MNSTNLELERRRVQESPPLRCTPVDRAQASACGKAIIVGEHAVVYGAEAIAIPIQSMQMNIELTPLRQTKDSQTDLQIDLRMSDNDVSEYVHGVIGDALKVLGVKPFSMRVAGYSTSIIGAGLGSSASLCVVVLRALSALCDRHVSRDELAGLANVLEERFHGNPSGLDTSVVACEQVVSFVKGRGPKSIMVSPVGGRRSWKFVLIDSGARSSTRAMIGTAAPFFREPHNAGRVETFNDLARTVRLGLTRGDVALVASAMHQAHQELCAIQVVGTRLDGMIREAERCGVLAAKITGAGGGGFILGLLDNDREEVVVSNLRRKFGSSSIHEVTL